LTALSHAFIAAAFVVRDVWGQLQWSCLSRLLLSRRSAAVYQCCLL